MPMDKRRRVRKTQTKLVRATAKQHDKFNFMFKNFVLPCWVSIC